MLITKHWVESVNATMTGDVHRTWGYKNKKTGITSGMAGQLERKEADIGGLIEVTLKFHSVLVRK